MKKILALLWILLLCLVLLLSGLIRKHTPTHYQRATPDTATPDLPVMNISTPDTPERVRLLYLNGQPGLQLIYDQLAQEFFQSTGIRVETVSSNANLSEELPVLFSVNDASGLQGQDCLDLTDTMAYANLASTDFTLTQDGKVLGIASEAEPFGLICNTALLARVGHTTGEIDSFADLKTVAEYITAHQEELGFGAFAIPSGESRFADLLYALPVDIRPIWNLYSQNSTPGDIPGGQAVFSLGTLSDMKYLGGSKLQLELATKIVNLGLSVRQAELLCKNMSKEQPKEKEVTLAVDYVAECEKSLSKHLGRGVKIVNGKRKGKFELEFYGPEDLQVLLDALMRLEK